MLVQSDSFDYAADLLPQGDGRGLVPGFAQDPAALRLATELLGGAGPVRSVELADRPWRHLLLTPWYPRSQYDRMIELAREWPGLPDRVVCVAGAGEGFHGFKGRPWSAPPGNLYVIVHLAPGVPVERFETAFTVLAALSVVDAIDAVPGLAGRAGIEWVNDILVDDAKVAGVLAYTLTQSTTVASAVLGIGLNVRTAPTVEPTLFTPVAGALRQLASGQEAATERGILERLMDALDRNYRALLDEGYRALLHRYRERSRVLGAQVAICREDADSEPAVIAEGRVVAMGDGLELFFEDRDEPVMRGRLILNAGRVADLSPPTGSAGG